MLDRVRTKLVRCAVYTRKSSEEGLEQDFNSLHAQREACEAYVLSQRHEGWTALASPYDDGGYSGGTMERPGLQRLLNDVRSGSIDVIVVYKVDRLTRALSDFARIVETFDQHRVSFVSVTQAFNTTTSMGRLTLNVLLSFAQFEREVTGERIRDKIAASKKKGMWMGGFVPLGYVAKDRTLIISEAEAETVRTLFRLYLQFGNVREVKRDADRLGLTTKRHQSTDSRLAGGQPFSRGHIYRILENPIYVGEIAHRDLRHVGQHPAIIERELWDAVQASLKQNGQDRRAGTGESQLNLLIGLLFDAEGRRFRPTHTVKDGKRHRYYVAGDGAGAASLRLPAAEIEGAVLHELHQLLSDHPRLLDALALEGGTLDEQRAVLSRAGEMTSALAIGSSVLKRQALAALVRKITVAEGVLRIVLRSEWPGLNTAADDVAPELEVPMVLRRRGVETRLVIQGKAGDRSRLDPVLLKAVARGYVWFEELSTGQASSIAAIAERERVTGRYVSALVKLAFVAPDLIEAVIEGQQPAHLSAEGAQARH